MNPLIGKRVVAKYRGKQTITVTVLSEITKESIQKNYYGRSYCMHENYYQVLYDDGRISCIDRESVIKLTEEQKHKAYEKD